MVTKRLRYQATAAGSTIVTTVNLQQLLAVVITSISGRSLIGGIRLTRIEMWGPMSSSLSPVTVSTEYVQAYGGSSTTGPNKIYSDTSMGTTGAYVNSKPPPGSLASLWIPDTSLNALKLVYPAGTIIDIHVKIVLASGQSYDTTSIVLSGALVGDIILVPLDGTGTANLVPVSYVTN